MDVYLLDGTYELFRHFFAVPSYRNAAGEETLSTALRRVQEYLLARLSPRAI